MPDVVLLDAAAAWAMASLTPGPRPTRRTPGISHTIRDVFRTYHTHGRTLSFTTVPGDLVERTPTEHFATRSTEPSASPSRCRAAARPDPHPRTDRVSGRPDASRRTADHRLARRPRDRRRVRRHHGSSAPRACARPVRGLNGAPHSTNTLEVGREWSPTLTVHRQPVDRHPQRTRRSMSFVTGLSGQHASGRR